MAPLIQLSPLEAHRKSRSLDTRLPPIAMDIGTSKRRRTSRCYDVSTYRQLLNRRPRHIVLGNREDPVGRKASEAIRGHGARSLINDLGNSSA